MTSVASVQLDPAFDAIARLLVEHWQGGYENPLVKLDGQRWRFLHIGPYGRSPYRAMSVERDGRQFLVVQCLANGPNSYLAALVESARPLWRPREVGRLVVSTSRHERYTRDLYAATVAHHRELVERLSAQALRLPDGQEFSAREPDVQLLIDVHGSSAVNVFHTPTHWIYDGRYYRLGDDGSLRDEGWLVAGRPQWMG